ncbi:MAG: cytochrome P450 [Microcystaceae cyanobacterium]
MSSTQAPNTLQTKAWQQTLQWAFNPSNFLETSGKNYGDLFSINLGFNDNPLIVVSHPQGIQELFSMDSEQLDAGSPQIVDNDSGERYGRNFIGGQSVVNFTGHRHQQRRKLLMPPFHGERMRSYGQMIIDITQQLFNQQKIDQSFCVQSLTQSISFQVILKTVFGLEDGARYDKINQLLTKRLEQGRSILTTFFFLFPFLRQEWIPLNPSDQLKEGQRQIDQLIYEEIDERIANLASSKNDILSLMMSARDEKGEGLKDIELRDELMTLLFAGHETTAISLAWALYWIYKLPEVRKKLVEELESMGKDYDPDLIEKLPYLDAVCKETLRIYPPAILGFGRRIFSPIKIMGYDLSPGLSICPCIYLVHHREELYPEPKMFKPERFFERKFSSYEYLPFGGGNRICLGMAFAKFEMKLVLATILSHWDLELVTKGRVKLVRRGILTAPSNNLRMKLKRK